MENRISASLGLLPSTNPNYHRSLTGFDNLLNHLDALLLQSVQSVQSTTLITSDNFMCGKKPNNNHTRKKKKNVNQNSSNLYFSSTSISLVDAGHHHFSSSSSPCEPIISDQKNWRSSSSNLSFLEKAVIGASAGGLTGGFTYVCLHPLDTIKTKLQAKGATEIYSGTLDAITKTFQEKGILGFYRGVSAVGIGSAASSAIYFGTCEFGKSVLTKLIPQFPSVLIPPAAGAMGNIVSSAVMVPKELITQRMQTGGAATGRSWEILLRILEKDGILGLYSGYSATLLRNLPAGVLSYSSFEYLKSAVLSRTGKDSLEPFHSVCCGALAGAISASITTPLDVVKTRLMTQAQGEAINGVSETVKQILMEEGWVGLTRGMGPRVLHSACFAALGYFAFETARLTLLHQYLHHRVSDNKVISAPT